MLSPEVSTFLPPHTWRKHEHGSNILQVCNSQQFNKLNEVVESVKIFLPESLHPPDVLKEFLLHDKDYYLIDQIKSIECCSTENFIRSFICEGSLFLQTVYGETDEINITLLPSGWLHLDATNKFAESLGLSFGKVSVQNCNRKLLSFNLKDMLVDAKLKKLQIALKQRVLFSKPFIVTWCPNNNNICPSTIAKYFHMLGGNISQKLPEMEVFRDQPLNHMIPRAQTTDFAKNQEWEASIYDIENIFAATVLQLPKSAISKVTGDDFDCIECKNSLYITVSNVYLLSSQIPRLLEILSNYLKVKQLTNQHYVSLTMCQPRGIVSTLMYPGKSTSKYYTNSRQTLLYKLDNSYSSLITKTQ